MLPDLTFILVFGSVLGLVLWWGFRTLPGERWQFLATTPGRKRDDGAWAGVNYTFYGVFQATANTLGVAVFYVLAGAVGVPRLAMVALVLVIVGIGAPASRVIAQLVERKAATFSIGAASFVGTLVSPWAAVGVAAVLGRWLAFEMPVIATLAAMTVGYAFGEGIGRLACVSFGCCYGKPLSQTGPFFRRIFRRLHFVFHGRTRKIAYVGGLEGEPVVPIQAVTCVTLTLVGLVGAFLFLRGWFTVTLVAIAAATQCWRVASELLRSDPRGGYRITPYQMMAATSVLYAVLIALTFPAPSIPKPDIVRGLHTLWHPAMILVLQAQWFAIFRFVGRSQTTAATVAYHVVRDKV
jgi:hypothetical protein